MPTNNDAGKPAVRDMALALARRYRIFPCQTNKRPLIDAWQHAATQDGRQVQDWWTHFPAALIGVPTGYGWIVIDIDVRPGKNGFRSLAALEAELGALPETFTLTTPSGGRHLYFLVEDGVIIKNSAGKLGPGLDVRGLGGYVCRGPGYTVEREGGVIEPDFLPHTWQERLRYREPTLGNGEPPRMAERDELDDALLYTRYRDDMGRDRWLALLMAYKAGGGDPEIAHSWCMEQDGYTTPEDFWQTWNSIDAAGGITAATLFREAHDQGWRSTRPARAQAPSALDSLDGWEPDSGDDVRAEEEAQEAPKRLWPEPMDLVAAARTPAPAPEFIIKDWLPVGYATLFAGHGSAGKSTITLTLLACIASGADFCGLPVRRSRVLYLACEDKAADIHFRLERVCQYLELDMAELDGWLSIVSLVGHDATLWDPDARRDGPCVALGLLRQEVEQRDASVIVLDGVADTFAGNENDRADVKAYVNAVLSVTPPNGAALLIAHVNKMTAKGQGDSEGYSGSTGWHNAVRARWFLAPEKRTDEDGEEIATGDRLLELMKTNYGEPGQRIRWSWDSHLHTQTGKLVSAVTGLQKRDRDRAERRGIEDALRAIIERGEHCPAAMQGPRTAFAVLSAQPEFPDSLKGQSRALKARFGRHLEALRQSNVLTESIKTSKNRHAVAILVLVEQNSHEKQ